MSIQLVCADKREARVPKDWFRNGRLNNPSARNSHRYILKCQPTWDVVYIFLGAVNGDRTVKVTKDNADELRKLCQELGYSGLDNELAKFSRGEERENEINDSSLAGDEANENSLREVLILRQRVVSQERLSIDLRHEIAMLMRWKKEVQADFERMKHQGLEKRGKDDDLTRRVLSLEDRVQEMSDVWEKPSTSAVPETAERLGGSVNQNDIDQLRAKCRKEVHRVSENVTKLANTVANQLTEFEGRMLYSLGAYARRDDIDGRQTDWVS